MLHRSLLIVTLLAVVQVAQVSAQKPRVESLVPGITIKQLPVKLTNIDSVEYGPDGRLYTAAYNGQIHVLTDTDGDGLEDRAELFWSKSGDLLTPVGILPTKEGVYVAARGKIALLKDTNGDGRADKGEAVVSGWVKETINRDVRNDAAGVAIDRQGNLYFSLGCMSYNKIWQLDKKGKSHYDINSERGTILKVSPDRKHREIFATGLRFVIGLEFNKHGDLFATDQEGDTWLPGGNPRDELLHIIAGRHYGFPFRHPKYLPDVIDEPEVVGYSPQHQSTCGFRFNETRPNRKPFGPGFWEDNAIVTGFSRGKLWRTPLAKTRAGYVGKQIQFAAFESMPSDVAISPTGDLLVTCHGGRPDWGSGPAAQGYLYKITFDRTAPQPVAAWPVNPLEVKIAFDRPIQLERSEKPAVAMGEYVWEGDRYEWLWPGYKVVKLEKQAVRRPLDVKGVSVSADGRTVTLATAPQPWDARYAVTLPGVVPQVQNEKAAAKTVSVSYDLGGVDAEWTRRGEKKTSWTGWLPHIDTTVNRTLTQGSAEHQRLQQLLREPGRLKMRSSLLLPGRKVAFRFESNSQFQVKCGDQKVASKKGRQRYVAEMTVIGKPGPAGEEARGERQQVLPTEKVSLEMELVTGATKADVALDASYHADFDPHERPLRLESLFVPWAPSLRPPRRTTEQGSSGKLVTGDPVKGREIFFGKEANCAACHSYDGKGGKIAADLTVTKHRDPEAVLRDILQPSAAINPDFVSYTVLTDRGRAYTGLIQSADEKYVTLVEASTKVHKLERDEIEEMRASTVSLMPMGFEKLGKDKLQDLVAFLCSGEPKAKKQDNANSKQSGN